MSDRKIIYLDDAINALEKVARLFPYRVPGNRDTYDRYNEAWNDAIGRAEIEIEELPSAQPEWIPCSERLPEEGVSVLISVGGMYSAEGCLRWDKDWNQFRWSAIQDKEVVEAWMPLPEPYAERREV